MPRLAGRQERALSGTNSLLPAFGGSPLFIPGRRASRALDGSLYPPWSRATAQARSGKNYATAIFPYAGLNIMSTPNFALLKENLDALSCEELTFCEGAPFLC